MVSLTSMNIDITEKSMRFVEKITDDLLKILAGPPLVYAILSRQFFYK